MGRGLETISAAWRYATLRIYVKETMTSLGGPTVAQARQSLEGRAGCAMPRTRMPLLGASAFAGDSLVSSPRNRPLTRARPPYHARVPLPHRRAFSHMVVVRPRRPPPPPRQPL